MQMYFSYFLKMEAAASLSHFFEMEAAAVGDYIVSLL